MPNTIDTEELITCPACGFEYCHPVSVSVNPAGNMKAKVVIQDDGLQIDKTAQPEGRGVVIRISYTCEEGHVFSQTHSFHNGQTTRYTFVMPDDHPIHKQALKRGTIWRD